MKYAHIKENDDGYFVQSLDDHLKGTADLSFNFGKDLKCAIWTKAIAQIHDVGKYSDGFQKYIMNCSGFKSFPDAVRVDHSSAGAQLAMEKYPAQGIIPAYCIAGHHSGLPNYNDLKNGRLKKEIDTPLYPKESLPPITLDLPSYKLDQINFNHWVRMLYSCLVDADFLDTEHFMNPDNFLLRKHDVDFTLLKSKLDDYLKNLRLSSSTSELNNLRNDIQDACYNSSQLSQDIYSLTVPTGGGKTLASIIWAINHAIHFQQNRIIIAIPYTSIITQTANLYKKIFGEENVIEHCSNFELTDSAKLAAENWDAPIIVTTNVQLFESMFANRPSACRKLHNICNSVIILDEVQMLPSGLLEPILDALNAYHSIFNVSILLSTASQPAIVGKIGGKDNGFIGLENVKEIVPDAPTLFQKLKRTDISIRDKSQTYQEIADELMSCEKVLCIVNTRSEALEIYKKMSEDKNTIHLSRMMCSAHIMEMISTIKLRLKNRSDEPLRVISTQLIEAGVDIDFPVVYRSIAGLDSIIQAAGRCNREGKLNGLGKVIVFRGEKNTPPGLITKGKNSMEELLHVNGDLDIFDPRTMTAYFNLLFSLHINSFDKADIKHKLYNPPYFLFKDAAEDFKMIDDSSFPIVVYYGDGCTYIEELKDKGANRFLLRKLQNYSVSVREKDFKELAKSGRIEEFDGIWVQSDPDLYHQDIGICMENKWLEETYIL